MQIGRWVLHTALEQAERWRRAGIAIPISVNVSGRELTELDLAERDPRGARLLPAAGPRALHRGQRGGRPARPRARARGAARRPPPRRVGSRSTNSAPGQHAFGLPRDLPLDVVKLDRALTTSFDRDKERRALFAATIALAKEAGLTAVAVGIETNRQLALARQLDCSVGQGFLLQGPAPADRVRLRDPAGAVTSAPWRPLVRLGGRSGPPLSDADPAADAEARGRARRPPS